MRQNRSVPDDLLEVLGAGEMDEAGYAAGGHISQNLGVAARHESASSPRLLDRTGLVTQTGQAGRVLSSRRREASLLQPQERRSILLVLACAAPPLWAGAKVFGRMEAIPLPELRRVSVASVLET